MKMLLCSDLRLGAFCTENLGTELSRKWQKARTDKYLELMDKAVQNNAGYIAFFGSLFGWERVTESIIDSLFQGVKENQHIQFLTFLNEAEYHRMAYRNDIPGNLHMIRLQTADSFTDDIIALRVDKGAVELQLSDNDSIRISMDENGHFLLSAFGEEQIIPSFEPVGFEDDLDNKTGFSIIEWTECSLSGYTLTENQMYSFQSADMKILPEDTQKDILRKINTVISKIHPDTFLRITLVGRSAFGLMINSDVLKNRLQNRIFFVEVYDNTVMDIDEETIENDISLRSEFVRLALQDDSLSESERNKIISCGWNALSGGEVSAE